MAIGITKKLINYAVQADLESCMRYFYGLEYQVIQSEDHIEAVKAFIEKRNPIFIGR
jgi:enoyl-CoA hydratase/carnithine racemase